MWISSPNVSYLSIVIHRGLKKNDTHTCMHICNLIQISNIQIYIDHIYILYIYTYICVCVYMLFHLDYPWAQGIWSKGDKLSWLCHWQDSSPGLHTHINTHIQHACSLILIAYRHKEIISNWNDTCCHPLPWPRLQPRCRISAFSTQQTKWALNSRLRHSGSN